MREFVFGHMRTARSRSDCVSAQSDQGLQCRQTESLGTVEGFGGKQIPGWDLVYVQDEVNPYILHILKACYSGSEGKNHNVYVDTFFFFLFFSQINSCYAESIKMPFLIDNQGPVVQSVVSLTSSLRVISLF